MGGAIAPFDYVEVQLTRSGQWVFVCAECGFVSANPIAEAEARMVAYSHNAERHEGAEIVVLPPFSLKDATITLRRAKIDHYTRLSSLMLPSCLVLGVSSFVGLALSSASRSQSVFLTIAILGFGLTVFLGGFFGGITAATATVPDPIMAVIVSATDEE